MKTTSLLIILLISLTCYSQGSIELSFYVDGKLLLTEDDYGNTPPTFNTITRIQLQGYDTKLGFVTIPVSFEYADLSGGRYIRYAAGAGFTFNTIKRLYISPAINYGRIVRFGGVFSSFEGVLAISYRITPKIKISLLGSITKRADLYFQWGTKVWRENFYGGLIYRIM